MNRTPRIVTSTIFLIALLLWAWPLRAQRKVRSFNRDWRFARGGQTEQARQPDFDDSGWKSVRLPHDWAIAGPFDASAADGNSGKLPWKGEGWYRKTFSLDKADVERRVYLDFDGVMAFTQVYVNGMAAGEWDYGYTSFRIDATPHVRFDADNVIAVHVDTRRWGTRWYAGAGIYRKVTLTICDPVHLAHWGTFVTTPRVSDQKATVRVSSTIKNHRAVESKATIEVTLLDPSGGRVGISAQDGTIAARAGWRAEQEFTVSSPLRWDVANPNLYQAKTILRVGDRIVDSATATFGIRSFQFTADDGFHLNGRRVQLRGVNLHHDHGPLGAAFYARAMERQLEIMRDMGVNAVRTSHNPSAPELLELCDRMGLVVWDECFDKWDHTAGRHDGQPPLRSFGERHLRSMVMRDRNHPSVVVWSIGNEIVAGGEDGVTPERVALMSAIVRKYDTTRPVGLGCHIPGMVDAANFDALDLTGWNYARRYARFRERYPDKPIVYSESASALSTRGFYELPLPVSKVDYSNMSQIDSYDMNAAPWSDIPDVEFQLMEDDDFVAGEFVWSGFDYLGEPTPFWRQARSSYFGIVDLCGIPKDRFYLYRSHWRPDTTTIHVLPHWNWPDRVGQNVPVFVYTNGDSAELFLNGRSVGRRRKNVIPQRPPNHARHGSAVASSSRADRAPDLAIDGDRESQWTAAEGDLAHWWQVDLGEVRPIAHLSLELDRTERSYAYQIRVSADGADWETVADKPVSREPHWMGSRRIFHVLKTRGRFVRIDFLESPENALPAIREVGIHSEVAESDYYDPTYKYRLRWNEVAFEPGELKVVAYRGNERIGEAFMRTAGAPASLRLSPDRVELSASGEDLSYILVEAVDEKGTPCPLAENMVTFDVEGPAEIAGVGNGNPLSLEPFQADHRRLFHGKAMLILRSLDGQSGDILVTARSEGLKDGAASLLAMN
jgi:beta-galactosidase